ncbi:MAG: hypothetical protein E7173_01915 [Firmicutes bacterium]|nr:hypothetical protein [Bacillota bacterium]
MKKNLASILIMGLLIFITTQILISSHKILDTVGFSFNVWKSSIFPSLFPFFVISEILINFGFVEFVGELFKPIMSKLFKVSGASAYVLIMGMVSGFPSSAKYVRELYNQGIINEKEGSKLLMFSHFSNPLFILGTISGIFLNNSKVGLLILFCHYITNFIIGMLFRNYCPSKNENTKFSLKNSIQEMTKHRMHNNKSIGQIISDSINNSINTLLLILGTITTFLIITTIIGEIINLPPILQSFINGIFEMTQGLKYISLVNISLKIKTVISTMFISFGGLSVHMQIISMLNGTKIKYIPFLLSRILHATIAGILVFILFNYFVV